MSRQTEFEIESTVISTRVTKPMYEALLRLLALNAHITISDYLRDLIRRDLEQKGLLKTTVERKGQGRAGSREIFPSSVGNKFSLKPCSRPSPQNPSKEGLGYE